MKAIRLLAATAGVLMALAGPSLAQSRAPRAVDAYTAMDRSGAYYYGPAYNAYASGAMDRGASSYFGPGYSAFGSTSLGLTPAQRFYRSGPNSGWGPYPDRPYGDPDSW